MCIVKDRQGFRQRMENLGFILTKNERTPYTWITPANPGEDYPCNHLEEPRAAAALMPNGYVTLLNELEPGMRQYQAPISAYFSQ